MNHRNHNASALVQFEAAFGVLFWRPAALLIWLLLLVLSCLIVKAIVDGERTTTHTDNTPSHKPSGTQLFLAEEWQQALKTETPDLAVRRLRMEFLMTQLVAGETKLEFGVVQRNPNQRTDIATVKSTVGLSEIVRKFPKTQWISIQERHLASLPIHELNELTDLVSINFSADTLKPQHLTQLSQLSKIQNLTIEATRCNADLGDLTKLKNLRSLHLDASRLERSSNQDQPLPPKLVFPNHIDQLASVPNLEELVIQDRDEFLDYAAVTGLTADNKALYEQFVKSIRTFPALKTLYVGRMARPFGDKLLAQMSADLPAISIRPAAFDSFMAFSIGIVSFLMFGGLFIATSHLMMCNSLEQNCLLTGARQGQLKVFLSVAAVLLTVSALLVMLNTFAELLPVLTFELSVVALVTAFVGAQGGTQGKVSGTQHFGQRWIPLLYFPLVGLVTFVWMGSIFWGAHVAKFLCGHFPMLCIAIGACAAVLLAKNIQSLLNVHRAWAEAGLPPAASWRELQESFATQQHQLLQIGEEAKLVHSGRPVADRWLNQLDALVTKVRLHPTSRRLRCQLWLAAMIPTGFVRTIVKFTLFWPVMVLWPMFWELFTNGASDALHSGHVSIMLMTGIVLVGIFVVITWHGRQAMFATEILRPVRRSVWRRTVFSSFLATVGILSGIVWGQIQLVNWLAEQDVFSIWTGLSLLSLLSAIVFATALFLTGLICQQVILAAVLIIIGLLAYVPMGIITAAQTNTAVAIDFPSFSTLLVVIMIELVVGAVMLNFAWKRWARLEVATL